MKKFIITVDAPENTDASDVRIFACSAFQDYYNKNMNGIFYIISCVADSSYNDVPPIPAGRHDGLIARILLDINRHGLQVFFSNFIYAVFQHYDEKKIIDKNLSTVHDKKLTDIFSLITSTYIQLKKILHTI